MSTIPYVRILGITVLLALLDSATVLQARDTPAFVRENTFDVTEGVRPEVAPAIDPRLGPEGRELPALRWYPSAHLPPVSEPYIFHYYGTPPPEKDAPAYNSRRTSMVEVEQRGILPLKWFYGPQNPHRTGAEGFRAQYLRGARRRLPAEHPDHLDDQQQQLGFAVDEWQRPRQDVEEGHPLHPDDPFGLIGSIQGMIDAKALNPEPFIAVYWRGEKSIRPALRHEAVDLLIIEGAILKRGDRAREEGYIDRTIFMHGYQHGGDDLETIERRIRKMRERFPEMPGMALYAVGDVPAGKHNDDPEWLLEFDRLLHRYFIQPAPDVHFTAPNFEAKIHSDAVTLEAEASGQNGRAIRSYRWFVDNRLVAETDRPVFEWDTSREWEGRHMLTVHAIDEDWNRSAAQIPVRLTRP